MSEKQPTGWMRKAPTISGHYWYRENEWAGHRVIRLGYPGRSKHVMDCNALAGASMTPKEFFERDPHGMFYFPALEAP